MKKKTLKAKRSFNGTRGVKRSKRKSRLAALNALLAFALSYGRPIYTQLLIALSKRLFKQAAKIKKEKSDKIMHLIRIIIYVL